ncbi:MAG TPA: glutamate racemase [Candidatus Saccharimonadales bacterium]|nr:glutamate racemase [Candidatus Saccharimonadales bacterium]
MKPGGKIGFFDSGLGGLSVMRAVAAQLPQYNYVYLGDTANKPYGNKPASEVRGHVQQGVSFLFDQGCELVIVVCNTATAQALRFIQQQFLPKFAPHRNVLGIIVPAAEAAVMATRTNRIGVIGTQGAIETGAFADEIQKLRPEAAVYQQAAPELVPMIESGLHHGKEIGMVIRHYLQSVMAAGIDTLILGCTHYERIAPQIAEVVGPGITLINPGPIVAERTQDYLFRHADLSHKLVQGGERRFYFTSNAPVFAGLGQEFYGQPITAEEAKI